MNLRQQLRVSYSRYTLIWIILTLFFQRLQNLHCAEHFLWISRTIRGGEQEIHEDKRLETEEGSELII